MDTFIDYEKALDILMRINNAIPNTTSALWVSTENYSKISTEYIINTYKNRKFKYTISRNFSDIIIKFKNSSCLFLVNFYKTDISRGRRYDFLLIDSDIPFSNVFMIGKTFCIKMFPPVAFTFDNNFCNKDII